MTGMNFKTRSRTIMLFNILKKDICKKRLMNLIILVFIILAGMFLASSVSNLNIAVNGIDDYLTLEQVADYSIISRDEQATKEIKDFLKNNNLATDYEVSDIFNLDNSSLYKIKGKKEKKLDIKTTVMACEPSKIHNIPLDKNINEITVKEGEIYIDQLLAKNSDIKVGDTIRYGEEKIEFKVAGTFKDAFLGNTFLGNKRVLVSKKDFKTLTQNTEKQSIIMADVSNFSEFSKQFRSKGFSSIAVDKDTIKLSYLLDMLSMAVLVAVSICLIGISLLVLRFTITFTIQDDYKQIGIMKALGFRNSGIKKLYIIKYLALSIIGGTIGLILSFPFGTLMTKNIVSNIIVKQMDTKIWLNVIAIAAMVGFICLFCYFCTRKLDRFSVIEAIRNGSESESFGKKSVLSLKNQQKIKPSLFMAMNDIISHKKRYGLLLITFLLGVMILIIPMNMISTIKSDTMYSWCTGGAVADMYISPKDFVNDIAKTVKSGEKKYFLNRISQLERKYKKQGVDIKIQGECVLSFKVYGSDKDDVYPFLDIQNIGGDDSQYEVFEGSKIKEANEVLLTKEVADKLGVTIGDNVYMKVKESYQPLIVAGLFRSMSQMGEQIRLSSKLDVDYKRTQGYFPFEGFLKDKEQKGENIKLLNEKYPDDGIMTIREAADEMMGNMTDMMTQVSHMLILLVLAMNGLITILMMKVFLTKETSEIALLKSLGFRDSSIQVWQVGRITIILTLAVVLGVICSGVVGTQVGYMIFDSMGAYGAKLTVKPLEVYLIYPVVILGSNIIMSMIAYRSMKKVDLMQINNME